jgi:hypothetical protein
MLEGWFGPTSPHHFNSVSSLAIMVGEEKCRIKLLVKSKSSGKITYL